MYQIIKSTASGLEMMVEPVSGCWINVIDPTPEETDFLVSLGIPQDFITYSLDQDERSRSEREDNGVLLILIRIPYFQGAKTDVPYITIPLGLILAENMIITVCKKENTIINDFCCGKAKGLSTGKRNRFVLRVLLSTAILYLNYLREIDKIVDVLEDRLQLSMRNHEVLELLKYQKSLVYFTTALKANELLLERMHKSQLFKMYPDDEDLVEDVLTENQQAIEMVNTSSNILSSMMDAFASIISNNLNVVMKFLTSATIVISLPSMVYGFFGMNVPLPYQDEWFAALLVIGLSFGIAGIVVYIFYKRDWF
ncbi:MAG TPA: magnesium transporter CorA family protein [Anaerolineaceae bacterium]